MKTACDRLSAKGTEPTEFEAITAAAMLYFYEQKCDAVVLEEMCIRDRCRGE